MGREKIVKTIVGPSGSGRGLLKRVIQLALSKKTGAEPEKKENYWLNHCYCCQKDIKNKPAYFTMEWDAYVCEECHDRIMRGDARNEEEEIIAREFGYNKKKKTGSDIFEPNK